jgi:hypothetical protein
MLLETEAPAHRRPFDDPERLLEEIAYMESRLAEIGHDGDCAYEKAMIRFYHQQVAQRRERLGLIG